MASTRRALAGAGTVFVLVFALALPGVWARSTYGAQVSVDEPQYLMTALSLAYDVDLDVSDEIRDGTFRSFHEPDLNTQTTPVDSLGRRFSPHDPLLPLLLAPAMRLAPDGVVSGPADDEGPRGWVAARLTMACIAALTAASTAWVAMRRLHVTVVVAVAVTTLGFSSVPLGPYSTQIYPEMPAALATMTAVAALTTPHRLRKRHFAIAMLAIVTLPWLAVKYVPVAAVIAVWLLARLRREDRAVSSGRDHVGSAVSRTIIAGGILAVAGVVYAVVHQRIYGGWTVYASGDHFSETGELSVVGTSPDYLGRSRRLVGLLSDRSFGLIPWQPTWLLAPVAVAALSRHRPTFRWPLIALAAGWATATFVALTMHGWWSPGRQVVVVAPIALLAITWLADRARSMAVITIGLGLLGTINWLWLATEAATGRRTIVVDFTETAAWPYRAIDGAFPDALSGSRPALFGVWAMLVLMSLVGGWWLSLGGSRASRRGDAETALPLDLTLEARAEVDARVPAE